VAIKNFDGIVESINDVSWANSNGRSFHLLAIAHPMGVKVLKFAVRGGKSIESLESMEIEYTNDFTIH
jgi:hypothetical protein